MLEEAAVHQHQVVARSAAVGGSFHPRAGRVEQVEGDQGHPPAAAATVGQYPSEVVGEGSGGGIVETVDRDMDPGGPLEGGDGISERVHNLGTASHLLSLDRGLHQIVPSERAMGSGS
jgi:hypothetical protein